MNKWRVSELSECLGLGVAFLQVELCRFKSPCQMRTAGKTNLEPRLSLFFGPDCSSGFHSGKDNRKRDKINPKIASDWIGGSAVRRLQRGCTCADRADGTGWVGLGWPCSRNLRHCSGCSADTELLHIHEATHRARCGPQSGIAWLSLPRALVPVKESATVSRVTVISE